MMPAYKPGDHVLTFNWGMIKPSDVIVFVNDGRKYLKRVDRVEGDFIYVSGDNKAQSSKVGPVDKSQIIGKVILKH